jgi:two-component system, NtrC family, sensor kinase
VAALSRRHARNFPGRIKPLIVRYNFHMSKTSGVLIVGHADAHDFGADRVANYTEAKKYLRERKPSVVVFGQKSTDEFQEFCEFTANHSPQSLWLLESEGLDAAQIIKWNNSGRLYDLIENFSDPSFEEKLQGALEASGEAVQRQKLVEMFEDQSLQLKRLTNELEARVSKRHKTLRKSLKTLEHTKVRLEAFHKALLGIHRASTIYQMEQTLNEALGASLGLAWVRVRFANQSLLGQHASHGALAIEIPFGNQALKGEVMFAKVDGKRFKPTEVDFLHEISEALALALSRLHKLEQAEMLKGQWQATFDSIPHPLCLTGAEFEILKMNRAFQQACTEKSFRSLLGRNCFDVFFGREFTPPGSLSAPFTFRNSRTGSRETETYEVIGERLGLTHDHQTVQLILLRTITDEARFERRIFAASKLAELGTIGSSIAHELNNPLGGMLSFLQLILMDIKAGDTLFPDIKGMEQAVLRCRDIVLNLLSFARKQDLGDFSPIDLGGVIDRAVKLIELQSKSMGIAIQVESPVKVSVHGSLNGLSQAVCNILQNSIDAVAERLKQDPLFPGKINIHLDVSHPERVQLKIADNGTGIKPELQSRIFNPLFTTRDPNKYSGMGLTTAFTIVTEHHGTLEVLSQTGSGTAAIIALPRLDHSPD